MVLITGSQRTGSSLLATFLQKVGYNFEGDNDEVGAYDDANICMEYRRLLNDPTFPWSNYPSERADNPLPSLAELNYDVAKYPFLMMHPRLMQIWLDCRGTRDKLLILVREAEKVVSSKENTPERTRIFSTDSDILKQSPEELKQNWFDSFMLVLKSGIHYRIMKFPEFLDSYQLVWTNLVLFGGLTNIPGDESLWMELVDKKKVTAK